MEFDPSLVHDWLSRTSARLPEKTALICDARRLTYGEIDGVSASLARGLAKHGVGSGDRVVLLMENDAEAVIGIYGVLKAGGVFVMADATSTPDSLSHVLNDSGAGFLIAHRDKETIVEKVVSAGQFKGKIVWVGDPINGKKARSNDLDWRQLVSEQDGANVLPRLIDVDLAALIYTSGSTGRPKGIMSTHHNIVSAAKSIIQYLDNAEEDVILDVLPLAFDYGLYQVIMAFMFGGTVVLERSMGFIEPMIRRIEAEGVTGFPMVPSISAMLLKMKRLPAERLASLRYVTSTGALWPAEHIRRFRELLPGVRIFSMYGLTECKRVGFLPPELVGTKTGSVGAAMPNTEALVVDEHGAPVPPGGIGELVVRGSNVMQGYWNDPEETARVFRPGRYPADRILHTGDWFRLGEDGLLYFVGRKDDLIKSFGRRVSPREVEDVAASMPGVTEAAAVGVPDEINGQVVGLFLTLAKDSSIDAMGVKAYCATCLEAYKVPRYVWFLDAMPKTPNGKFDKKLLREKALAELGKNLK